MVAERPASSWWHSSGGRSQVLLAAASLLLALGMIDYYSGVLFPIKLKQFEVLNAATGNRSDLYPIWLASRELLLHRRNPYSEAVTREIQEGFYGRPVQPTTRGNPINPEAFAYPVYLVFLLAPFVELPFDVLDMLFTGTLLIVAAMSVPLWAHALRLELKIRLAFVAIIATMSSFAVLDDLWDRQTTLLVAAFIAISIAALASGRMTTAGVLLGLSMVKPQLAFAVVAFILLWSFAEWHARKWVAFGFAGVMAGLLLGSEILLPGWFHLWREAVQAYLAYHKPSLLVGMFGEHGGLVGAALAALVCGVMIWHCRKEPAGSRLFNFALISAIVLTQLVSPSASGSYYNQVILIPAVLWLFTDGWDLARKNRLASAMWAVTVIALIGQWILALPVSFAASILRYSFPQETTWFVIGPKLLVYCFPLSLALFALTVVPLAWRSGGDTT